MRFTENTTEKGTWWAMVPESDDPIDDCCLGIIKPRTLRADTNYWFFPEHGVCLDYYSLVRISEFIRELTRNG